MNTSQTLEIKRMFDAPPDVVFDAWMVREQWQAWIGPEGVSCDVTRFEPTVGGHYRLVMNPSDRPKIMVTGVFEVIERPHRVVFTWGAEGQPDQVTTVTLILRDVEGRTELTLRHDGLPTEDLRLSHGKGWNSALNKLESYLRA